MTTDDPDDAPTQFGMDKTVPGREDRTLPAQPVEDRTLPAQPAEDRTLPSQPAEDRTLPAQQAQRKAQPPAARSAAGGSKPPAGDAGDQDKTAAAPRRESSRDPHGGLLGKTLGGCRVDKLLGKGAMGAVYKAVQLKLDRPVAVKVIRPEMMTDPRMLKRFEVEARTVGRFNSANVVMVHDVGFEQGVHYLVMEFVQGKNLREHVKLLPDGRLPVGEALPLIRQACAGLNEARRLGVVHRDIKPDNLMLTDQGVLKIADFGIAKPVEQDFSMTLTSELIGTPLYMSPEQCQGGADIDFRSDMYSLGATFFYLLTGEPPIRASSVYELIQTKTKLENLCLWKALPELGENNPLSRVIERMTANDRDDRYESYEELVNDLVLVQEGGTITLPVKKTKKAVKRLEEQKGGKGGMLAIAAVVAIAAGGGGYWWVQNQPGQQSQSGGAGGSGETKVVELSVPDGQRALALFRDRLRDTGPSSSLREEVAMKPLAAALEGDRERLLGEVDMALGYERALAALTRPEQLQLPFDDIKAYYRAIADASKAQPAASEAVRTWLAKRVDTVRDETALAADGRTLLTTTFGDWQEARNRSGGDDESIAALMRRLDVIDAGRVALATLYPTQLEALERALPAQRLIDARKVPETGEGVTPDADVELALAEAEKQLQKDGPLPSVEDKVEKLRPKREDLVKARKQLLDAIGFAKDRKANVERRSVPEQPVAPFQDVKTCYAEIDTELDQLRDATRELPEWAKKLRSDRRREDETQQKCVEVCKAMFAALQELVAGNRAFTEIEPRQLALDAAIKGARELFPKAESELAKLTMTVAQVMDTARVKQRQQLLLARLADMASRLAAIRSIEEWRRKVADIDAELAQLRAAVEAAPDEAADTAFAELGESCERWRGAAQRIDEVARLFDTLRLKECLAELAVGTTGREGRDELEELNRIALGCQELFRELESSLQIEPAQQQIKTLRRRVDGVSWMPAAIRSRLQRWENGLRQLGEKTARMVPITGGKVGSPSQEVSAFFMWGTEIRCDEFTAFVRNLKVAAGTGDREARFKAVESRLAGSGMTSRMLQDLLDRPPVEGALPIDRISWYEAAAYAAWHDLKLPTPAQWALAAFGDGNVYTYPWGNEWPPRNRDSLHTGDRPVDVGLGGLSWRTDGNVRLRHLAGNVAEWLRCEVADRMAPVAGGRSGDFDLRVHAGGELEKEAKDDTGISYVGFRVVLELDAFAPLEWPH